MKWTSSDTLEMGFILKSTGSIQHDYQLSIHKIIARVYVSVGPNGPWTFAASDTMDYWYNSDSISIKFAPASKMGMQYIGLTIDFFCQGVTEIPKGYIFATKYPVIDPADMDTGPDLVAARAHYSSSSSGSALSADGMQLITGHAGGTIFDFTTGADISPTRLTNTTIYLHGEGRWIDSMLFLSGNSFVVYNTNTYEELIGVAGNYSYPLSDTSFVFYHGWDEFLAIFNTRTMSSRQVVNNYVNGQDLNSTTVSPSGKFVAAIQRGGHVILLNNKSALDEELEQYRYVTPFSVSHDGSYNVYGDRDVSNPCHQWGKDDRRIYFWSNWSGSSEIWTYSLETKELDQITGLDTRFYPGEYSSDHYFSTINFLSDLKNDRLILFFMKDHRTYATRFLQTSKLK